MNGNVMLKTDGVKLGGSARYVLNFSYVQKLMNHRTGYDFRFGERTKYLDVFYDQIKDKSKILLKKNITSVEQFGDGINVKCEDGTSYRGDILAGADGVRSKVREEMWRLASSDVPNMVEHDRHGKPIMTEPPDTFF
jgi:2-polyprenyl-6-methoxyphenol hydroxylase-like FAD-dependent oxidoreductase